VKRRPKEGLPDPGLRMNNQTVRTRLGHYVMGVGSKKLVSAPGRVDFLNTHQDYKGLPVVPVAIGLRCYAMGGRNDTEVVRLASLNLEESSEEFTDEFRLGGIRLRGEGWFGDYVRAVFRSLASRGHKTKGMDIAVWSEVPIGSGLSSSAALEVSISARACWLTRHALQQRPTRNVSGVTMRT
jgi:galactokinase